VEPGAEIGMEACGSAHHWARLLQSKGNWGGVHIRTFE
jgi:transposase